MLLRVKKHAVVGSPISSTCSLCLSKNLGGGSSGIGSVLSGTEISVNKSGRCCLIVAIRLERERERREKRELIIIPSEVRN